MKEVIVKYKSNKTLEALKDLGKYLGFSVSETTSTKAKEEIHINGVKVIPGDESIDISDLHDFFTDKGLDANQLRSSGWQRKR